MKIFYFTSTGNGLAIAKKIGGELYSIPQVLEDNKFDFEDESIGIIFPCYTASINVNVKMYTFDHLRMYKSILS